MGMGQFIGEAIGYLMFLFIGIYVVYGYFKRNKQINVYGNKWALYSGIVLIVCSASLLLIDGYRFFF